MYYYGCIYGCAENKQNMPVTPFHIIAGVAAKLLRPTKI
jgi:hypothetical protein